MKTYESFQIIIEKKAQKFLESLDHQDYKKIVFKIQALVSPNEESLNIKKLKGYKNLYRLKVDDYRVIFLIILENKKILIPIIGHRKEVYDIAKRLHF